MTIPFEARAILRRIFANARILAGEELPRCPHCKAIMDMGERARGHCNECEDAMLEMRVDASIEHEERI